MREYYDYINGVLSGKIATSRYIKQAVERLEGFKHRPDMYFDEETVKDCFEFIACMKEWSGAAAGKSGALLPFQKWIVGSLIGIKWKKTNTRVCKNCFMLIARKNAKTSLIAKLSAYLMICDGEANPFIGCVASSRDQARILFEAACNYLKTIDPTQMNIKLYRNYIKFPANNGEFHVYSSDYGSMDGYNFSTAICDEVHSYKDNKLIAVLQSSMGARKQPLLFQITTAGFLLDGFPCFETYKMSIEILAGVKNDDSFFPFLYVLDDPEEIDDEDMWIKCNPGIDTIVSRQYLREQLTMARNDTTQVVNIKTKNFNLFCNSAQVWIPTEKIAKCMHNWKMEDFAGKVCYIGVDLAQTSDLVALAVMVPDGDKYYFKNWAWVPRDTYVDSPNHALYEKYYEEGSLLISEGNITDYQLVTNKIIEISNILNVQGVYYDMYNASQWAIQCTELGLPLTPFRQGLQSFNAPTKEMERLILSQSAVFDKSLLMLWEFSNCILRVDHAQNVKCDKTTPNNKIDNVISSIEALGGYLLNPVSNDIEIFVI